MILILDGNSVYVAHMWRSFKVILKNCDWVDPDKGLQQVRLVTSLHTSISELPTNVDTIKQGVNGWRFYCYTQAKVRNHLA